MSEWGTCSLPSPWKSRPGAEYWGPQHHTGLLTGRLCIVRFGAGCVAPWGPGIACVGVLDTLIPRPHWRPLLIPNHGGASLESFASIPRQNARVQDHFHRAHISFPAGTSPPPPPSTHHTSEGHVSSFLDHYSEVLQCTVPNLALACSDKTLYVFCMA